MIASGTEARGIWSIYRMAKAQITEQGAAEPLVSGIKRAGHHSKLPDSPPNNFFHQWYDMIEDSCEQLANKRPLGVSEDLAPIIRDLHALWRRELLTDNKIIYLAPTGRTNPAIFLIFSRGKG
ncbi:hypothetical protein GGR58DRAFT_497356 [Xylaria digitata]|nr:hypothetical protein GGR58DRAFT_497356 [Xylaria digitata]